MNIYDLTIHPYPLEDKPYYAPSSLINKCCYRNGFLYDAIIQQSFFKWEKDNNYHGAVIFDFDYERRFFYLSLSEYGVNGKERYNTSWMLCYEKYHVEFYINDELYYGGTIKNDIHSLLDQDDLITACDINECNISFKLKDIFVYPYELDFNNNYKECKKINI